MLKRAIVLMLPLLLNACASAPPLTEPDIVRIAQAEVARQGYSISLHWRTVVVASSADYEFQPPYRVYLVRFQSARSERSTVFKVTVNPASGKVEDFTDMQTLIPLH